MPNHLHLLLESGRDGISVLMRNLLAGYAGAFNRKYRRAGYLFQNRFKSVLVDTDPYFLELVRYIHLNPVRAGLLPDLAALDRYPWTGHPRLLGADRPTWQATEPVLERFGRGADEARRGYRRFLAEGWNRPTRDLDGGGLRRSRSGIEVYAVLGRGREAWAFDERILGSSEFVQRMLVECTGHRRNEPLSRTEWPAALHMLGRRAATRFGVDPIDLRAGGRRGDVSAARALVAYAAVCEFGITAPAVATFLGVTARAVRKSVGRGRALAEQFSVPGKDVQR